MVDFSLNRPPTVEFWRNCPVAGSLHTGNLADRYVPLGYRAVPRTRNLADRYVPSIPGEIDIVEDTCKVCNFDLYRPVRAVHTGARTARYRAVPPKIDRQQSISAVGGRLKKKSIVGGRLRKKKGRRRGKKKKRRKNTSSACRPRPPAVVARGSPTRRDRFFSRARHCPRPPTVAARGSPARRRRPRVACVPGKARTARYVPVRQLTGMRTGCYRAVLFLPQVESVPEMTHMVGGAVPSMEQREENYDPLAIPDVDK
ncbi:hypothetical protein BHM03_00010727 [Ensete ventricosum]|nr:hypothetical protein BHM03_00010727 [Ensete ventricosum]